MYVEDTKAALDRFGPCLVEIYGQGESPMTITVSDRLTIADKSNPNWTKKRKRRSYENERLAYTKHSFSWFQDMLLESKVRVQINVCCFSYFFCF